MFGFIVFFIAFLLGALIAHYTSFLINNSEDCRLPITFKFVSMRSILICAINGLLWLGIYMMLGITVYAVISMIVSSILLAISVVDFSVFEIPVQFNIALAAIGVVCLLLDIRHYYEYIIGAFIVSGIFYLAARITKGEAMGGGDIKLMAATGLMLGWKKILFVMVIGCIIGIVIHGIAMIVLKKKRVLPFGPYLSMATYIMLLVGDTLVQWYIDTFLTFTYL